MQARIGDRLIVGQGPYRTGEIIAVPRDDGQPPYAVKWLSDGNIAIVLPDQYMRIVPASHPAGLGRCQGTPG